MPDVFAIQDEIAKAIADRLQVTLGVEGTPLVTPATGNLDAYHLYLKGRYYLAQRGLGLKKALECFDQALALDPDYALAYAGLADACTVLAQYGLAPPNVLRPKARAAVQRALDLAPDLAEVHCASGALGFICDWDWPRAARDLRRAVELNPRYVAARQWLSCYLVFIEGRLEEGVAHAQRAVELDPLAPLLVMQLGMTLMGAGRYEEAAALGGAEHGGGRRAGPRGHGCGVRVPRAGVRRARRHPCLLEAISLFQAAPERSAGGARLPAYGVSRNAGLRRQQHQAVVAHDPESQKQVGPPGGRVRRIGEQHRASDPLLARCEQ